MLASTVHVGKRNAVELRAAPSARHILRILDFVIRLSITYMVPIAH